MIKPINLPGDLPILRELLLEAFHYPKNPEWEFDDGSVAVIDRQISTFQKMYPILRHFSAFANAFRGYIFWLNDEPVGFLVYIPRTTTYWEIAYVGVAQEHRRKGIAKQLLKNLILERKKAGGGSLVLEVVQNNQPALELYKSLGFGEYSKTNEMCFASKPFAGEPEPQSDFLLSKYVSSDERYNFELKIKPKRIQRFEPVIKSRFSHGVYGALNRVFRWISGMEQRDIVVNFEDELIGILTIVLSKRGEGINSIHVLLDEDIPKLPMFAIQHALNEISISNTHITKCRLPIWLEQTTTEAQQFCTSEVVYCKLGLVL